MFVCKIPELKKIIFSTVIPVRIDDINYGNHLGHDSLVSLLHEARVRFLKNLGVTEININRKSILITNLVINYMNEAFHADQIIINIEIGDIKKASLQFIYQAINQETKKEVARALTTAIFFDYHKSKIAKIPNQFLLSVKQMMDNADVK